MSKMSRDKGRRGEREIIDMLQPIIDEVYETCGQQAPLLQRNLLQSHLGGSDVHGLEWLAAEVKRHETGEQSGWWAQTLDQCGPGQVPVLFFRRSREAWRVRMFASVYAGGDRWHTYPVVFTLSDFLVWFRARLCAELGRAR